MHGGKGEGDVCMARSRRRPASVGPGTLPVALMPAGMRQGFDLARVPGISVLAVATQPIDGAVLNEDRAERLHAACIREFSWLRRGQGEITGF